MGTLQTGSTDLGTPVWAVPRAMHTYFLENLLGVGFTHVRTDLIARFFNFFKGLLRSGFKEVRILANIVGRHIRSTTCKNLWNLRTDTGLDGWQCGSWEVKKFYSGVKAEVPLRDQWRPAFLTKVLMRRGKKMYQGEEVDELTELIDSLCAASAWALGWLGRPH